MFEIIGQYNKAFVFAQTIDETTRAQIQSMLNNPAFEGSKIAIQADCHAGAGSVIGFTATFNKYVIPNIVGVDIGCGVLAVPLGQHRIDLAEFDSNIKRTVPSGFNGHFSDEHLDTMQSSSRDWLERLPHELACWKQIRTDSYMSKVGTLGGGNHFLELDKTQDGSLYLVIHTGSRNLGLQVAEFYQKMAAEKHPGYKDQEFLSLAEGGEQYLHDMRLCQLYAQINRMHIADLVFRKILHEPLEWNNHTNEIESVHNYIGDDHIIRKGAISARVHDRVVIPMNMSFGTVFGVGKGSEAHNFSAPHGAGRVMGRGQAKRTLKMEDFTKAMDGIYTTTAIVETLDEAPMAYKDPAEILPLLAETVDITSIAKPIYSFKDATSSRKHK